MEVRFAFLCDFANESGGKLNALGLGWNSIFTAEVPVVHPQMSIVAGFEFHVSELGQKAVQVRMIDADGADVSPPLNATFEVKQPESGTVSRQNIILNMQGLRFDKYGDYSVHVTVDGEERARLVFAIERPPTTG